MRWRFWQRPDLGPFVPARKIEHPRAQFLVQQGKPDTLVIYSPIRIECESDTNLLPKGEPA